MTLTEYWLEVDRKTFRNKLRYGQIAYNLLSEVRPDLAAKVAGTLADPFYVSDTYLCDGRFLRFCDFLLDNWGN